MGRENHWFQARAAFFTQNRFDLKWVRPGQRPEARGYKVFVFPSTEKV
jgi:hypothetical protein